MSLQTSMIEALRLTRSGDLSGATALLRTTLAGQGGSSPTMEYQGEVIDLTPEQPTPRVGREQSRSGDFIGRSHSGSVGTIEYMLYRPAATAPNMPLVVMLHGCTQTPEDCARGTGMNELAEELGFLVAYPRQTQAANQQRCWNWFRPGDQARGRGEPALIAGIVRDVIAAERIDAERVYVAGLSAGGAAAAIMADAYPDLFAAVGVHSGLACGAARDLPSALTAMNRGAAHQSSAPNGRKRFVPVITFHGDRDRTVIEANAREIVHAASRAAGVTITVVSETGSSGGRRFTRALSQDAAGRVLIEQWTIAGGGHAWSGGNPAGSHADAAGPDASRAMLSFFERHRLSGAQ